LYLFLVTVSDAKGLSYYGDDSIMNRLAMDPDTLQAARENLIRIGLIGWKKPLYQVLPLDPPRRPVSLKAPVTLKDIFTMGGYHDRL
jgi:hypothetical protein